MKKIGILVICLILLILDNSVIPFLSIKGYYPSLLFSFAIAYSIINGKNEAVYIGSISGILQDVYFYKYYGINSFTNLILCVLAAGIGESIFKNKRFIPVVSTFFISISKYIIVFIILYIAKIKVNFDFGVLMIAVMNMICMFFIYKRVYKFSNKDFMKEQWKFNK